MIEIGKYTITSRVVNNNNILSTIYNISINGLDPESSGEGMDLSEDTLYKLIDDFYQETF